MLLLRTRAKTGLGLLGSCVCGDEDAANRENHRGQWDFLLLTRLATERILYTLKNILPVWAGLHALCELLWAIVRR